MTDQQKVLVNLATGLEDAERVTIAFRRSKTTLWCLTRGSCQIRPQE